LPSLDKGVSQVQIIFDSMTGNVRRFSQALGDVCGLPALDLKQNVPEGSFLLVTYTFGRGDVPVSTQRFLEQHAAGLCGVVSSGSFHWGENFARAGDQIAARYSVPLIAKINKSGSEADKRTITDWLTGWLEENRG